MRRNIVLVLAGVFGLLVLAGCGGVEQAANPVSELAVAPAVDLPWPPPAAPARQASDFDTQLFGSEWTSKGGSTTNDGTALRMSGATSLPWAIYSVTQLGTANELTGLGVDFSEEPGEPGDGTNLFVALANYDLGAWEWFEPASSPFSLPVPDGANYRNAGGQGHAAVALAGPGEALVNTVTFSHTANTVPVSPPENLTGQVVDVELVELDWDDVEGAAGYYIYRATNPDLDHPERLTTEPVAASEYQDDDVDRGRYYWYWVTAVAGNESLPSNVVRLWSFEINLPAPTNLRITDRGAETFTMAWDYDWPDPSMGFQIYVHTEPDFIITDPDVPYPLWVMQNSRRSFTTSNREPGVTYYWKMCALGGTQKDRGRISEEATGSCAGYWTWGDVETIAEGQVPLSAAQVGDEMAVGYFNGIEIDVAVRDQGTWTSDTALAATGDLQFTLYLDMAYAEDTYLVASYDGNANDSWAAHGGPGSWTRDRVHGDGVGGLTLHGNSGHNCRVTVGGGELAVIHHDVNGDDIHSNPEGSLKLHTRPISGGSWTTTELDGGWDLETTMAGDLAYLGTNLYVLWMRTTQNLPDETDPLAIGDRDGGWNFVDVRDEGAPELSAYINLTRFSDEWLATGFYSGGKDLYLLNGTTVPWNRERLAENRGYYARLAVEGSEAIAAYYGGGTYYFARSARDWEYEPISVPGTDEYDSCCDVLLIGGVPHFFFRDEGDGMIKVARGSPPEE